MRTASRRSGYTLLELSAYIGIAAGLLATMGTIEILARRATFYQVAALDALEGARRTLRRLEEDLEGHAVAGVEVTSDGTLVLHADAQSAGDVAYLRSEKGELVRKAGGPEGRTVLARHVSGFVPEVEFAADGRALLVRYVLEVEHSLPSGHRFVKRYAGAATVGGGRKRE
ncbi:MAG: hypothetical protein HY720_18595 [Planctomycetes bacterium]|nr:hypothetical protein [Planctomycetota bacterium]